MLTMEGPPTPKLLAQQQCTSGVLTCFGRTARPALDHPGPRAQAPPTKCPVTHDTEQWENLEEMRFSMFKTGGNQRPASRASFKICSQEGRGWEGPLSPGAPPPWGNLS